MEISGKVVVVTGAGKGIGAAICKAMFAQNAAGVVVSDIDAQAAAMVAAELSENGERCLAFGCDVSQESEVQRLVEAAIEKFNRVDVFVSNAGITAKDGLECSNEDWQRLWDVNVMSRLFAARAVVPHMLKNGGGYLVHTASAAALLTEIGSAGYSVTKHADLAMAEWLAVCYGRQGIGVSCICPLGVHTDMLDDSDPIHRYLHLHAITAEDVAKSVVEGIRAEQFLILPHPEVAEFFQLKADDRDRWIRGMQRLRQKLTRAMEKQQRNQPNPTGQKIQHETEPEDQAA